MYDESQWSVSLSLGILQMYDRTPNPFHINGLCKGVVDHPNIVLVRNPISLASRINVAPFMHQATGLLSKDLCT